MSRFAQSLSSELKNILASLNDDCQMELCAIDSEIKAHLSYQDQLAQFIATAKPYLSFCQNNEAQADAQFRSLLVEHPTLSTPAQRIMDVLHHHDRHENKTNLLSQYCEKPNDAILSSFPLSYMIANKRLALMLTQYAGILFKGAHQMCSDEENRQASMVLAR